MTSPIDIDRLERLARSATPGPWTFDLKHEEPLYDEPGVPEYWNWEIGPEGETLLDGTATDDPTADLAYIAACSPDVILRLIAVVREVEASLPLIFDGSHIADCPYVDAAIRLRRALGETP